MTTRSWQPTPVTKCGECTKAKIFDDEAWCSAARGENDEWDTYEQNSDGITQTCPMWQQQNKPQS